MNGSWDTGQNVFFGPKFAPFTPISGEQEFSIKIGLCHFLPIMDADHHAKNQKKLMKCSWNIFKKPYFFGQNDLLTLIAQKYILLGITHLNSGHIPVIEGMGAFPYKEGTF